MSTRNLEKLIAPRSVVAIGASTRPGSVGAAVTANLLGGGFQGDIHLVNLKGGEIAGRPVRRSLAELPAPADHDCCESITEIIQPNIISLYCPVSGLVNETSPAGFGQGAFWRRP